MKVLKIKGPIEPEMIEDIISQIEKLELKQGDEVDVVFDSQGGVVDIAFELAGVFEDLQTNGIKLRAVAEGKVYSSAIVMFLACEDRVALDSASFLVHKATYPILTDVDKDQLKDLHQNLEEYTDMLYDFYEDHDVSLDVRKHLREGEDLLIAGTDLEATGFIDKIVDQSARLYNWARRKIDQFMPPDPQFSFIFNYKQLINSTMTQKQIQKMISDRIAFAVPEIIAGVAAAVNARACDEASGSIKNAATALSKEELEKLTEVLYKTPVVIEGNDDVKFLVHPAKNVEKDHFVIPTKVDGETIKLPEGDYKAEVDGEQFVIHSTGEDWYLHSKEVKNQDEELEEIQGAETEAPEIPDPEKVENNKASKAPNTKRIQAPVGNTDRLKAVHDIYSAYGPGCIGR